MAKISQATFRRASTWQKTLYRYFSFTEINGPTENNSVSGLSNGMA